MRRSFLAACFLLSSVSMLGAARAADADWPAGKPVTVIVASAAGGSADVLTRLVLNHVLAGHGRQLRDREPPRARPATSA